MPKATKIVLIGNYGAGNLGDDSILEGITQSLQNIQQDIEINILKGNHLSSPDLYSKFEFAALYPSGLRSSLNWSERRKTQELISNSDLVLIGGGGLFVDTESHRAPYIWYRQALAAKRAGKPYAFIGISIGPLHSKMNEKFTLRALKTAKWIHVRDEASLAWLKSHNIKHCSLGTDFALHWLKYFNLEKKEVEKQKDCLIVLRNWPGTKIDRDSLLKILNETCNSAGLRPVLIPMDLSRDEELEWMEKSSIDLEVHKSTESLANRINEASAAIMMRLHANIFSLSLGVPTFTLSYGKKVSSFLETNHIQDGRVLELSSSKPKELEKALSQFFKTYKTDKQIVLEPKQALLRNQAVLTWLVSHGEENSPEWS